MGVGRSRIGLVFGALLLPVVILAVVEVGLRMAEVGSEGPKTVSFDGAVPDDAVVTVFDRELLFRLAPSSELLGFYKTNADGHRGPDFPPASEAKFRILAIGDSCTFGLGVHESQTWPVRLESLLDRAFEGVTDFEVLNLGVPGYSSYQNRRQIELEVERLRANGVVWMATGYNDALLARSGSDAELAARFASPWSRLAELRVVQLFAGKPSGFMGQGAELAKLTGGSPRVGIDEFEQNVATILAPHPSRATLSLEVFGTPLNPLLAGFDESIPARRARLVAKLSGREGIVDPADRFAGFHPYELYADSVHPTAEGQQLLADAAFQNIVRGDFLAASPRRDWLRAVFEVGSRRVNEADAELLSGPGALPWFATLLATDASLAAFSDAVRFDPLVGSERGEYESGRLGLLACGAASYEGPPPSDAAALRDSIREHVVPPDPFDAILFGGDALAAPPPRALATARCLVVLRRWLGLSSLRVDRRVSQASVRPEPSEGIAIVEAAIALDPRAWYPRRVHAELLRKGGRVEEARQAVDILLTERPQDARALALRGMIALSSGDHVAARAALEASLAVDPVQVEALYGLGRIALFESRFDEALRRFGGVKALHASLFPDLLELIEKAKAKKRLDRVNR